ETALPVGSGVDSELQGFLQNKTSELLNNCFPTAGAIKIRPLRLLVNNGWETFIQVPLQDYKAATGIDVVMHALPYNKVSTAILQQLKVNASDAVDSTTAPAYDAFIIPGSLAIMASIMQTGGVTQGWLFDPLTLEPLTNNTASEKVLHIMWALSPFLRTFDTAAYIDMSQCAVALAGASIFKSCNPVGSNPQLMGQLGISPLPASTEVLDRSTMQLVPCTPQLCNSQRASVLAGSWANLSPSRYQNIILLSMSTLVPQELRSAVYDLIAFLSAPTGPLAMLWAPVSTYAPFRSSGRLVYQVGEPWDQPGITLWSSNGYNYTDVRAYDKALTTILTLPGTAMEWRVADSQYPLYFIYGALNSLLGNEVAHT
ncbi:guanylate cyclase domain-containing protein, partial [Haematococcus lacustris]